MMIDKNLSMADIAEKINREFDDNLSCIFSGNNADKLVLRLRITSDETLKGDVQNESAEDDVVFKKIESNMLTEMALRGILDIKKVFIKEVKVNKFDDNGGFKPVEERMLDTDGVDLLAVMCHEDVDATRTTSNHLTEVIEVLGIEAARRVLLDELRVVISFDGSYVNYRHLALLCDTMTYRGHLMAIKGHGINRNETGPFMRCSFEETVDILIDAAVYAESDYLRGATENIMLGQLAPIGTGGCSLFLNDRILNQAIELQLSSHMEGLDFGMTATPSPLSRTPYHEGMISPDFRASPIDTNALDSPYVRHMALSPIPSQVFSEHLLSKQPKDDSRQPDISKLQPNFTNILTDFANVFITKSIIQPNQVGPIQVFNISVPFQSSIPSLEEDYIAFRSLDLGEELEKMDNTHRQIMRKEMQNSRASVSYLWQLNEARGQKCKLIRRDIAAVGGSCQEIPAYLIRQY
ncbi:DNA-directed RNA polymerase II subunit RPB1-like [Panicum virgatum]|uniref:DNA-directed RNA polymerase II subunit RPB1-like n=1 Tax=Panicum virgatum TaxID=38727 RepID=UPI0019D51355|nr:DNA-directed RNA polymerase II subunit RPB1-like [Panicum virgatum]